jgi:hypothetical protein
MARRILRKAVGRRLSALALALAFIPASAMAEKIIGTVSGFEHLENPVWTEAKDPKKKGYSFREMVPTVPAKYRKLYPHIPKELCLAALSKEAQPPQPPTLIRVGGGRTTPVTIVVTPGTKLVFENTDPFTHRLFIQGDKAFPPSDTAKGGKREWSVPGKGVFEIRDELAPSLRMWVVGEPNVAAITYPSMAGEFNLTAPAPGDYEVQAFFAGGKVGDAMPAVVSGRDIKLKPIVVAGSTPTKKDDEGKKEEDK